MTDPGEKLPEPTGLPITIQPQTPHTYQSPATPRARSNLPPPWTPEKRARTATASNSAADKTGLASAASACSLPVPSHEPGVSSAACSDNPRFKVGTLVKKKINGRAKGELYKLSRYLGENTWLIISDRHGQEEEEEKEDNLALARPRGLEACDSGEGMLNAAHEENIPCGWHKVGVIDKFGAYYQKAFGAIEMIPFTDRVRDQMKPELHHDHVDSTRVPLLNKKTAGNDMHTAIRVISEVTGGAARFKIGITGNPYERFDKYQEEDDRWQRMVLVWITKERQAAGVMESALIREFRPDSGQIIQNRAPGGEGVDLMGSSPFFVYVVLA